MTSRVVREFSLARESMLQMDASQSSEIRKRARLASVAMLYLESNSGVVSVIRTSVRQPSLVRPGRSSSRLENTLSRRAVFSTRSR